MPRIESLSYSEGDRRAVAEIERDLEAGAFRSHADHAWVQDLCANTAGKCNPSIFGFEDYFVMISRLKAGDLLLEVASVHGVEGGRLQLSEAKAGANYVQLVTIGDADDDAPPMMRVCRDAAGRLSLAFGKGAPAPYAQRVFAKYKYIYELEPSSPQELCLALSKFIEQVAKRRA
jgi:hypothetical protein